MNSGVYVQLPALNGAAGSTHALSVIEFKKSIYKEVSLPTDRLAGTVLSVNYYIDNTKTKLAGLEEPLKLTFPVDSSNSRLNTLLNQIFVTKSKTK